MKLKVWHLTTRSVTFCSINFNFPVTVLPNSDSKDISANMKDFNDLHQSNANNKRNMSWLNSYAPQFCVSGKNVKVLKKPSEFFEQLKELSKNASRRITLASLYIGTGPLEQQLVTCIQEGLQKSKGDLNVKILLDYSRGSRGSENSRTLLLPLLQDYPSVVNVSLYHTPDLRGFFKWVLPERWNETIGLTHLKVYLFDDTLILSGANLSDQYFTNRQDRYVVFNDCPELCNYFDKLVATVSDMSFQLKPNNTVALSSHWSVHPTEGNYKEFIKKANKSLQDFIDSAFSKSSEREFSDRKDQKSGSSDTYVYPLLQMYTLGIRQDEHTMERFLRSAEPASHIKLASGYFNLTTHYMNIILGSSKALYSLLVASPKVNGFYGASGLSGAIPMAYTHIVKNFFSRVISCRQQNRIKLHEYDRDAWTFHVKGLWYYRPMEALPSVTFIGSPNFGYRSVYKDLEAQVAIVTENRDLQEQLNNEQERLYKRTVEIDKSIFVRPERKVSFWVKVVTFFIKDYF